MENLKRSMKTLIIDDEALVREQIKFVVGAVPELTIVGEAGTVAEAVNAIAHYSPDLLLLDIELTDGLGFDVLERSGYDGQVIFITAHSDYAIKAFRAGAVDYLLKPLQKEDFKLAYDRVQDLQSKMTKEQLFVAKEAIEKKDSEHLIVKTQEAIYVLKHEEILFCKSDSSYTQFNLIDGQSILVSKTLKEFELVLEKSYFFRCHKSYLVNLNEVHRVNKNDTIAFRNGKSVPLATRKREQFLQKLSSI